VAARLLDRYLGNQEQAPVPVMASEEAP